MQDGQPSRHSTCTSTCRLSSDSVGSRRLRKAVRARVQRGHVQLQIHLKRAVKSAGASVAKLSPCLRSHALKSFRDMLFLRLGISLPA